MSFAYVPGVPAAPPTSGLVAAAVRPDTSAPEWEHWELGLSWTPERCGTNYQLAPYCQEPPGGYEAPRAGAAFYQPVEHRHADECSTLGGPLDAERVRRVADAQSPYVIARELWTGEASAADPYTVQNGTGTAVNAHLASDVADVVGASAADPLAGFGRLEQAALEASHGQQVYLHVPVLLLPQLRDVVQARVGSQLITIAGNVLVADGGYPGTGPEGQAVGATAWCYATSPVAVLTSPWDIDPDEQSRVDRATNTRITWASRVFAATFDPCVHLATEITL